MSDFRRAHCMPSRGGCGRHRDEVGGISWGGLCIDCAQRKMHENANEIHFQSGPAYERWLLGIADRAVRDLESLQSLAVDADG